MTIRINKNEIIKTILLGGYFFIGVFAPPFSSIPCRFIVMGANIVILVVCLMTKDGIRLSKKVRMIIFGYFPFITVFFCQQMYHVIEGDNHNHILTMTYHMVFSIFFVTSVVLAVVAIKSLFEITEEVFLKSMGFAVFAQFMCVLFSFLSPAVKSFFNGIVMSNSTSEILINAMNKNAFRNYGFAENLFDLFGYISAILITIVFIWGLETRRKSIVLGATLMILMPIVNARTGVLLAAVGFAIAIISYFNCKRLFGYLTIATIATLLVGAVADRLSYETIEWLTKGFEQTRALFQGQITGIYSEILGNDIVFPEHILIGTGGTPEQTGGYDGIDSGYIQCIWRFGLIGTALLIYGYINMFIIICKDTDKKMYGVISVSLIAIFLLYLFKLYSITSYTATFLLFSVSTGFSVFERENEAQSYGRRDVNAK